MIGGKRDLQTNRMLAMSFAMWLAAAMLPLGTAPVEATGNVKAQKPSKTVSNDAAQDLRSIKSKVEKK